MKKEIEKKNVVFTIENKNCLVDGPPNIQVEDIVTMMSVCYALLLEAEKNSDLDLNEVLELVDIGSDTTIELENKEEEK